MHGIIEAEVTEKTRAECGERTPEHGTGTGPDRGARAWGRLELRIPKVREGSYYPSLLEPRRRSERALLSVVQQAYVEGVSTRRVDDLVKSLGCEDICKSQVSRVRREFLVEVTDDHC